jgi:hypothetical protein
MLCPETTLARLSRGLRGITAVFSVGSSRKAQDRNCIKVVPPGWWTPLVR